MATKVIGRIRSKNPNPIKVPCHRVEGTYMELTERENYLKKKEYPSSPKVFTTLKLESILKPATPEIRNREY